MIRTVLRLTPAPGRRADLISHYLDESVLSASRDFGWLGGEVDIDPSDESSLFVTSTWPDRSAYDRWLASPERAAVLERMAPLLDGGQGTTQVYEVVESSTPAGRQILGR